jgi:hypothetical protein
MGEYERRKQAVQVLKGYSVVKLSIFLEEPGVGRYSICRFQCISFS